MTRPLRLLVPALLVLFAASLAAQPVQERYAEVLLALPDGADDLAARLAAHGLVLDHARVEETAAGRALRTVLSETELEAARAAGAGVEVLVADLAAEVAARAPMTASERAAALAEGGIQGNIFGSMGGYPTFSEAVAILDDMRAQYPQLISARVSIGQSHEGRDLWMVEVSDNPGIDEGEPEVLLNALHHAREPAGLTTVLYTLWYLLENYDTDARVRYLVNNRRLFVVPVLNPDGYVYNEQTDPNGGGMWRKNRRNNGGGEYGVDLNRNYGYEWGYDNSGSSPNPWSETYRGPAPFSEPETQAIRDFFEDGRAIRTTFNYHTYGDLLLFAWAYEDIPTPDHNLFMAAGARLTAVNGYEYGTSPQVLYASNGNANDWMYGEQATKPKVFSFTPEVGPSFWPSQSQIVPLAVENLRANLLLMHYAGLAPGAVMAVEDPLTGAASAVTPALEAAPNPFAASTTVAFTLPEEGDVRLAVYDLLGREVAVLVDDRREAGRHEAPFDASGLAPGVYLGRLTAGGRAATRRLVVTQ